MIRANVMPSQLHYLVVLNQTFADRQSRNPSYSMRAFSRDLGLNPATLSLVLKGKRPLPTRYIDDLVQNLELSELEQMLFRESIYQAKTKLDEIKVPSDSPKLILDESHRQIIAEWEHLAILTLYEINNYLPSHAVLAERLGVEHERVSAVVDNLFSSGLLVRDPSKRALPRFARLKIL